MSKQSFSHETYISPFTWRYGSPEMRHIWSEIHKRKQMRRVWVALAAAQQQAGLVTEAQVEELRAHMDEIDIGRALEIEAETRHDVMAEIRAYAEQCPTAGGIIHWGATSADVNDNVYGLRMKASLQMLAGYLQTLLLHFAERIDDTADLPTMAHTHIQPAEPTTLGYRFAVYAQDLLHDWFDLTHLITHLKGKGFKGAVGTQAGYEEILADTDMSPEEMEAAAMQYLGLDCFPIATQTYSRQQDLRVMNVLSGISSSLHKWAMDFRVLQSPPFGEWAEPFGKNQVGSSAMPFKRNPINMENICSLARYVGGLPAVAWDNASQAILERSLDDSANRRVFMAEGFLAVDELLRRADRILKDMHINEDAIRRNMEMYGPFAATERVMMAVVSAGGSRQDAHEWLREHSLRAWTAVQQGRLNPLADALAADERILQYVPAGRVRELMTAEAHVGTAPSRARAMARRVRHTLET